jgi:hypothetical protein
VDHKLETSRCYILELHLGHLLRPSKGRSSRYNEVSVLSNPVTVWNIPRSPSLIGVNISRIFMPRRFDRSHETIRKVESQSDIQRLPRYDNTSDLPQPCYGVSIFWDLLILSERTCLRYYHLGGWSKCVTIVLEWDKTSIPKDQR